MSRPSKPSGGNESHRRPVPAEGAMKQTSKTAAEVDAQLASGWDAETLDEVNGDSPGDAGREQARQEPDSSTRSPDAGETHWSQASADGLQTPVPKQPTERDESASSQSAANASMGAIGRLAHHDAMTGVDTDRGPVLDAVYNGPVTEGHRMDDGEDVHGERDPAKSTSSRASQKR